MKMGCAPSGTSSKSGSLRLMTTKLTFTKDQLDNLNTYFRKSVSDVEISADIRAIESTVERLVQRLVAGVGNLDRRFSSMFLVSLNERRRIKQLKFEYLLRIDTLSTPVISSDRESAVNVEEDASMPGFVRLRIRATEAESWAEFLGSGGRIRRDLIKAKVANLLAAATRQVSNEVKSGDEQICCCPGQIVDAEVLDKILKQPDHCRVFYSPATSETELPEPKEHRVALVEDGSGILLRIGLDGTISQDVEVRLLIGAAVSSWSTTADYPRRVPLHHCDALLHYTATQTGMYATAVGPYPGARCEDRATLWRIRVPAVEIIMSQHYADESVPSLTDSVLQEIVDQLQGRRPLNLLLKRKDCLKLVSRYILRTIHWWSLERAGPDPLRSWAPDTLSRHVLLCLDELVRALKCQNLRCYFHPRCNVMLQCAKGGILHHEDSYVSDSKLVESYLTLLNAQSTNMAIGTANPTDVMENELISRWQRVMTSIPRGTMGGYFGYSSRQLQYLGLVIKEVLRAKDASLQGCFDNSSFLSFPVSSSHSQEPMDNLVYLLTLVLKQARDQIFVVMDHRKRKRVRRRSLERRRGNASAYFERSVDILVDVVRRDRETAYMDLENDLIMAETLLKWLYYGMEQDRKTLGPILRPYLGNLFNSSHENAWHVESWKKRQEIYNAEMRSLAMFCKLVTTEEISPANGIVESLSKGWNWSEDVARMIERTNNGLKLVFITSDKILRYNLMFAENKGPSAFSTWSKARNISNAVKRVTMARINLITVTDTLLKKKKAFIANEEKGLSGHFELRNFSPLTYVISMNRRRGRQRGPGGLISALVTLNKFRILQEVAQFLPQDEKVAMLDMVQKEAREASRCLRRSSCPDRSVSNSPKETYTPRSESNLCDSPRQYSPNTRQRRIITEHQRQLQREMLEMHDTLTRGLRTRSQLSVWDSSSFGSWKSSVRSISRCKSKKGHNRIWDTVRGTSPMWDSVSTSGSFAKSRSEEMISREDSPKWNTIDSRCSITDQEYRDTDKLPSWDVLEANLNRKLLRYDNVQDSLDANKDVGIDYLLAGNEKKEKVNYSQNQVQIDLV